jgi:hypothetical protein
MRATVAGMRYAVIVFAIGFVLGTIRIFLAAPRLGELAATALEVPVLLAASWLVCGALVRHHHVPASWRSRGWMGAVALVVLMLAELALAWFGFGQSLGAVVAAYARPAQQLGLAAQLLFVLLPLVRHRTDATTAR